MFIGLGAYVYFSGKSQLAQRGQVLARGKSGWFGGVRARMAGTVVLAGSFVGMGVYRLVN